MSNKDTAKIFSLYAEDVEFVRLLEKFYNKTLNPNFWKNDTFDEGVREKLLAIANEFYESLNITAQIIDIQLTGSLANFNYTPYSDLDVHLIIDFNEVSSDTPLVKKALDGVRFIWNERHDIVIRDHDVELYVQDVHEQHTASGLYSLLKNSWIKKPSYNPPEIDENDVKVKFVSYVNEIQKLEERLEDKTLSANDLKLISNRAAKLKEKIQKGRKDCLQSGNEFCVENLVFKELRGTGMIERLIGIANLAYDKMYSEEEDGFGLHKQPNIKPE